MRRAPGGLDETPSVPPGRAVRPESASSVAPVVIHYRDSLRPCLGTAIAPRRRARFRQALLAKRNPHRVDRLPVEAHLEVEMRAGAVAGAARDPEALARLDDLARAHPRPRKVRVKRRVAAAHVDEHDPAVAFEAARLTDAQDAPLGRAR